MESYINNPPIIADIFTNFEILDDFIKNAIPSEEKIDEYFNCFVSYLNKEIGILALYCFDEDKERTLENIDSIQIFDIVEDDINHQLFVLSLDYSEEKVKLYIAESKETCDISWLEKIKSLFINYKLKQKLEKELSLKEETKKKIVKV